MNNIGNQMLKNSSKYQVIIMQFDIFGDPVPLPAKYHKKKKRNKAGKYKSTPRKYRNANELIMFFMSKCQNNKECYKPF